MKKKILWMAFFALASFIPYACAHTSKEKKQEGKEEVVPMNNRMFIDKVFDYTTEKEWKYNGTMPAVIDFYADWCGPCRRVAPIMRELAEEYKGKVIFYKVDTDKEKELAGSMGIQSLPTIVFIPVKGKPQVIVGAADKATFQKAINEVLLGKKE